MNSGSTVALLGELSNIALTYKREKDVYTDNLYPDLRLTTFTNRNTATNASVVVGSGQVLEILNVVNELITYTVGHIRPYNNVDYLSNLTTAFNGVISGITIGNFIDNGQLSLPEWISWTSDANTGNKIRIWLSDTAFRSQYDEYEMVIVPPFQQLDHFFTSYTSLSSEIPALLTTDLIDRMEVAKLGYPETYFKVFNFDFHNSNDVTASVPSEWGILIYGKAGDNLDIIKDVLQEYILNNSSHVRAEWTIVYPDIFKRTEFIIVPRWDKLAIPNLTQLSGIYSSMLDPIEAIEFVKTNVNIYPDPWVNDNTTIVPYDYKAITLTIIDGVDNIVGKEHIDEVFSDYIPVSSITLDFGRMSIPTREWAVLLGNALIAAETSDEFASVPEPLRKIKRLGVLYISFLYDNVNYLVAARSNTMFTP